MCAVKDKTGNAAANKKTLERELNPKTGSNYVPTSCDDYTDETLQRWFEERDFVTNLLLSLNKNRLDSLGSKFCYHTTPKKSFYAIFITAEKGGVTRTKGGGEKGNYAPAWGQTSA